MKLQNAHLQNKPKGMQSTWAFDVAKKNNYEHIKYKIKKLVKRKEIGTTKATIFVACQVLL